MGISTSQLSMAASGLVYSNQIKLLPPFPPSFTTTLFKHPETPDSTSEHTAPGSGQLLDVNRPPSTKSSTTTSEDALIYPTAASLGTFVLGGINPTISPVVDTPKEHQPGESV